MNQDQKSQGARKVKRPFQHLQQPMIVAMNQHQKLQGARKVRRLFQELQQPMIVATNQHQKLQGFALELHHETLKSKITRNKERKEDVHFTFKLCHKMLNFKAKSHKEQDRKESSIEHTLSSKLCHEMLKLMSSISIQQSALNPN
jgi:hypothetical protein